MRKRMVKAAAVGAACLAAIAVAESPGPGAAEGWYWVDDGGGVVCEGSTCYGDWDNQYCWEYVGKAPPVYKYPQTRTDDAYISWDAEEDLVVTLVSVPIDAFVVNMTAQDPTISLTFESKSQFQKTLRPDSVHFSAHDGPLTITVTDDASIETSD